MSTALGPQDGAAYKNVDAGDIYKPDDSMAEPRDSSGTSLRDLEPPPRSLCHTVMPYIHGGCD